VVVKGKFSASDDLLALASECVQDSNHWKQTQAQSGDVTFHFIENNAAFAFLTRCAAKGISCRIEKAQKRWRNCAGRAQKNPPKGGR
jgi:hypothetical protein